jgi:pathogenesis-related protein 1
MHRPRSGQFLLCGLLALLACRSASSGQGAVEELRLAADEPPSQTLTLPPEPTPTPSPTRTPEPTPTPNPEPTPRPDPTPAPAPAVTQTPEPTAAPSDTGTAGQTTPPRRTGEAASGAARRRPPYEAPPGTPEASPQGTREGVRGSAPQPRQVPPAPEVAPAPGGSPAPGTVPASGAAPAPGPPAPDSAPAPAGSSQPGPPQPEGRRDDNQARYRAALENTFLPELNRLSLGQKAEFVDAHNYWRNAVGVPPLAWAEDLATIATGWAKALGDKNCAMQHSSREARNGTGENLYWASARSWSNGRKEVQGVEPKQVVDSWGGEIKDYDYADNRCRAGRTCGHYTQMVWKGTREVGCARRVCADSTQVWVCNYRPAGNYVGRRPY